MIKRVAILFTVLLLLPAAQWGGVQKDPLHTGSSEAGPNVPLRRAWMARPHGDASFTTWPVVSRNAVIASAAAGVIAVEPQSGRVLWNRQLEEGQEQVSPSIDETKIYIPVPSSTVVALHQEDGQVAWRFQSEGQFDFSGVLSEGSFFVGSEDPNRFYKLNAKSGSVQWQRDLEEQPDSVPVIANEHLVLVTWDFAGSGDGTLRVLDQSSGKDVWDMRLREGYGSPAILDDKVVLGNGDFQVHAIDKATGKSVWKSPTVGRFDPFTTPAVAFGDVFIADRTGQIYRIDGKTGKREWMFDDTEGAFIQSSPIVAGKTLLIGSSAGFLYALDADSGRLLWKDEVDGSVLSGAVDDERWYFGVKNGHDGLYAYEHDPNGRLEPHYTLPSYVIQLAVAVVVFGALAFILIRTSRKSRERS